MPVSRTHTLWDDRNGASQSIKVQSGYVAVIDEDAAAIEFHNAQQCQNDAAFARTSADADMMRRHVHVGGVSGMPRMPCMKIGKIAWN